MRNRSISAVLRKAAQLAAAAVLCVNLAVAPAAAVGMGSVNINGAQVAYQSQYDAYTAAAVSPGSAVVSFKVGKPKAGKSGALCRILMPQNKNYYIYLDEGSLVAMRYDGSEYKIFTSDYLLKTDVTYTLCVFQDGLVLMDGTECYRYSGNFFGFTDIRAGWSDESNIFSVKVSASAVQAADGTNAEQTDGQTEGEQTEDGKQDEKAEKSFVGSTQFTLLIALCLSSNLLALLALRSSNIALRTVQRVLPPVRRRRTQTNEVRQTNAQPKKKSRQKKRKKSASPPQTARRQQTAQQANAASEQKKRPEFMDIYDELTNPNMSVQSHIKRLLDNPFELYQNPTWVNSGMLIPCRFGTMYGNYCTVLPGDDLASDPAIVIEKDLGHVWLNPTSHRPADGKIILNHRELYGLQAAFNYYQAGTDRVSFPSSQGRDIEMVNFIPAEVKEEPNNVLLLSKKGVIVYVPLS